MKVKYDCQTQKWFKERPYIETTVVQCEMCKLFYKPSLGHKCKGGGKINEIRN